MPILPGIPQTSRCVPASRIRNLSTATRSHPFLASRFSRVLVLPDALAPGDTDGPAVLRRARGVQRDPALLEQQPLAQRAQDLHPLLPPHLDVAGGHQDDRPIVGEQEEEHVLTGSDLPGHLPHERDRVRQRDLRVVVLPDRGLPGHQPLQRRVELGVRRAADGGVRASRVGRQEVPLEEPADPFPGVALVAGVGRGDARVLETQLVASAADVPCDLRRPRLQSPPRSSGTSERRRALVRFRPEPRSDEEMGLRVGGADQPDSRTRP